MSKNVIHLTLLVVACLIVFTNCNKECDPVDCNFGFLNQSTCSCTCNDGFSGVHCDVDELCQNNNIDCQNGGECLRGECDCPDGYLGEFCEKFDENKVQLLLTLGESPLDLYNDGIPLSSIYGRYYKGGRIFYLNTTTGEGLVAGQVDITDMAGWGCAQTELGVSDEGLYDGSANSMTIASSCAEQGNAASLCISDNDGAYQDYYLPSKGELNLLWENFASVDESDHPFFDVLYWSSTESDANKAWSQNLQLGYQKERDKSEMLTVRAIRAF